MEEIIFNNNKVTLGFYHIKKSFQFFKRNYF